MTASISTPHSARLVRWLLLVAALVVVTVGVGGVTRLTESGLSITTWKPLSGVVPPLSDAAWQTEFAHYQQIDQYSAIHSGMKLAQFKVIFFWEYLHRMLGRVVGMAIVLPLLWFGLRRMIPSGYTMRLIGIAALVGLQGTLGWLMVRSGLQPGMTAVAPLWLAAHLLTALTTLALLIWTALDLRARDHGEKSGRLRGFSAAVLGAVILQLFFGALVAGMRAGQVAPDWPLMQGKLVPAGIDWSNGFGAALISDPYLVHFIHRWWAWVVVALLIVLARRVKRHGQRAPALAMHIAFGLQILLGIATVMSGVALWLAAAHQLVGALLVIATVWGVHELGRKRDALTAQV
jgi:heme a synthase